MATVTIEIPDDLRDPGEAFAEAIRQLPPDSLRAYLQDFQDDAWCARAAREVRQRIASGESHWVDWSESEARLDALPD